MMDLTAKINEVLQKLGKIEEYIISTTDHIGFYWFDDFSVITYTLPGMSEVQKAVTFKEKLIPTNFDEMGSFIHIIEKEQYKKNFLDYTGLLSLVEKYPAYLETLKGRVSY